MTIKKRDSTSEYETIGSHPKLNEELVGSSDRAAALLGASILDLHLGRFLSAFMIDDHKAVDLLLSSAHQNAPLSTLAAKARAAFVMGLISRDEFEDVSIVRDIRNVFAHHIFECDFQQPEIERALDNAKTPFPAPFTTRVRFTFLIATLETRLAHRASLLHHSAEAQPFRMPDANA